MFKNKEIIFSYFESVVNSEIVSDFYLSITVEVADIKETEKYLPVITYFAGYCCYYVLKKISAISVERT